MKPHVFQGVTHQLKIGPSCENVRRLGYSRIGNLCGLRVNRIVVVEYGYAE